MKNRTIEKRIGHRNQETNQTKAANLDSEVGSPSPKASKKKDSRIRILSFIGRMWAWLFLGLLIFVFSFSKGFFQLGNFQAVLANNAILLVLALGQTFVIISGGIDLSTGFAMGLASVTASIVMRSFPKDTNLIVVILAGFLICIFIGVIIGLINGTLVSHLKVPPFIATLGTLSIARGIGYILSGGPPVSVNITGVGHLGNGYVFYFHPSTKMNYFNLPDSITGEALREVVSLLPFQLIYIAILLFVMIWILSKTKFGQHVYAIGGSQIAALRAGIPVNKILIKVYILSSLMAAISGFLYILRYTGGVADAGDALNLSSIAAIVIGGASLMGGEGSMIGTLVGTLIIAVIQNGLIIIGVDPFWQYVAVGVIIIMAVLIDQIKAKVLS